MNRKGLSSLGLIILAVMVLFACAKPPQTEMAAATAAVEKAKNDSNVTTYAPDSLKRATDSLEKMNTEAAAKRYDNAKTLAQETVKLAEQAIVDGKAAADRAQEEAKNLIASAKATVIEVDNALAAAKKLPRVKLDYTNLTKQFNDAKAGLAAAEKDQAAGNYKEAVEKAKSARAALSNILSTISNAVQAASKKK
ncbi:MAG: DUF4398 domain-containing protein [Termitinemataceae bacterium]